MDDDDEEEGEEVEEGDTNDCTVVSLKPLERISEVSKFKKLFGSGDSTLRLFLSILHTIHHLSFVLSGCVSVPFSKYYPPRTHARTNLVSAVRAPFQSCCKLTAGWHDDDFQSKE